MASDGDHGPQIRAKFGLKKLDEIHSIALSSINPGDGAFRITTQTQIHDLADAIQQLGLLHPPTLKQEDHRYKIVSGFRRIDACRQLGWSDIPAFILRPEIPDGDCALLAIADNSFERPLNPVEISRALYLLSSYFNDVNVQLKYATQLGLCDHRAHFEKIEKICHLPGPVQDSIIADTISLTVALDLSKLDPEAAVALSGIIDQLKIGFNKQRQLIVLFKEIALRENTTIPGLMHAKEIREILDNTELDRVQISRGLISYLKQRRFPAIMQFGQEFENQVKALRLGNSAALTAPRDFEGTTYTLTLRFDSHAELKEHQSRLDRVVKNAGLKKLLNGKMK